MPESNPTPFQNAFISVLRRFQAAFDLAGRYVQFNHVLFAAVFLLSGSSFWLSYEFRFDFRVPGAFNAERLLLLPYVAALKVVLFYVLRGHATNWRYIGLRDLPRLVLHCFLCALVLIFIPFFANTLIVPKGVVLIDFLLSMALIGGARISLRILREWSRGLIGKGESAGLRQVIVIGAGDAGEMIIREIARNPESGMKVRALFDDDERKIGLTIHGIRVFGTAEDVPFYISSNPADQAIVAIPSANSAQMQRIYRIVRDLKIPVKTLPSLHEIIEGSSKLTQLRDINITDLLGREEVRIDSEQVQGLISDKKVVVTGAGGSIGAELCRQIAKRGPDCLILIERSENNLFHIHRQLRELIPDRPDFLVPLLCDITDEARIGYEFERLRPDLVFHAAAYKHVPMQEINPAECFRNNVGGTRVLVEAAHRWGVSRFLMISTDKAVHPISVMGASKRVCELYCQAYGRISPTKFLSVRFGNVLASEGSVVPLFMDQIARGGPVTITHPDMRRYFMTIPEAVTLVLQAAALGESGQIMVLEMGDPIRIVDMAHQLMHLVGKNPEDVPVEFIGVRPGEKLSEEIFLSGEIRLQTLHEKIKVFDQDEGNPEEMIRNIEHSIARAGSTNDPDEVRRILREIVPEYHPADLSQRLDGLPDEILKS